MTKIEKYFISIVAPRIEMKFASPGGRCTSAINVAVVVVLVFEILSLTRTLASIDL